MAFPENQSLEQDYQDIFTLYDRNHNGYLSLAEFKEVIKTVTRSNISNDEIATWTEGVIKDDRLDFEGFKKVLDSKIRPNNSLDELIDAFKLFDRESTGQIPVQDFKIVLNQLNT